MTPKPKRDDCCTTARRYAGLDEAARLFRALGDETRLAIVRQLRDEEEVCACDFLACCDLAQPTVSHHLAVLREADLVHTRREGKQVFYSLNQDAVAVCCGTLMQTFAPEKSVIPVQMLTTDSS